MPAGARRVLYQARGASRRGKVELYGQFTVGASGAITAGTATAAKDAGFTVAKNAAAGRYDVTLTRSYARLGKAYATLIGPASAAFTAGSGGGLQFVRNANVSSNTAPSLQLQFARVNGVTDYTDTDLPSGTVVVVEIVVFEA